MTTIVEVQPSETLGITARWTAAVRAKESEQETPLLYDPWAAALAGAEGMTWIDQRSAESVLPIALRTRFFDDYLQRIVTDHDIRQVILMAAGLDTRAFRLNWPPQTRLFEMDQEHVLTLKESVLRSAGARPTCDRRTIAVDLTYSWEDELLEAGFDRHQPSVWLLEGFLFYLPIEKMADVLDRSLRLPAAGSFVGFDIVNALTLTSPITQKWIQMQADLGAPWLGSMDDPASFLAAHGWRATLTAAGGPEANYGRWTLPVIPVDLPNMPHLWFVTAKKLV